MLLTRSGVAGAIDKADRVSLQLDGKLLNDVLDRFLAIRHLDGAIILARGEFPLHENVCAFAEAGCKLGKAVSIRDDIVPLSSVFDADPRSGCSYVLIPAPGRETSSIGCECDRFDGLIRPPNLGVGPRIEFAEIPDPDGVVLTARGTASTFRRNGNRPDSAPMPKQYPRPSIRRPHVQQADGAVIAAGGNPTSVGPYRD